MRLTADSISSSFVRLKVHRGHGVFDTATLADGRLYRLSVHLERLLTSAERARIPHGFTVQGLKERVEAACAASGQQEAAVRFWLTAGTGATWPTLSPLSRLILTLNDF